jgi:UDP-N-acetylglucosamine--N-acetylmuramyl-(pentapeptide) pyrophosphoryl-undecaprenol N-acetylglucosamine transferase
VTGAPIALAAGGTGGHLFPAAALAAELARRGRRVALVTDARGARYAERFPGASIHVVASASPAGGALGKARAAMVLARGVFQAGRLLRRLGAAGVVGFGGYASFPPGFVALRQGRPLVLHEQNAYLGLANRKLAQGAKAVATGFPRVAGMPAGAPPPVAVGNPVRPAFLDLRQRPYAPPGHAASAAPFRLLVLGGSQGARVFSRVVPEAVAALLPALRQRLIVAQQCRPEDIEAARAAYAALGLAPDLATFFDDVPGRLAAAHLLIARAGASTVSEAAVAGRPMLLVPYPHATDDHQRHNAESVAAAGAGWAMAEPGFTPSALAARLTDLAAAPERLAEAAAAARGFGRPDAAAALADLVERHMPPAERSAA